MKKIHTLVLLATLATGLYAQNSEQSIFSSFIHRTFDRHIVLRPEWQVGIGYRAGLGSMLNNGDLGYIKLNDKILDGPQFRFSQGIDITLTQFTTSNFGFTVGLSYYRQQSGYTRCNLPSVEMGTIPVTYQGNTTQMDAEFTYLTSLVDENYQVSFIEVPLMLAARSKYLHADLGFRVAIPIASSATYTYGETSANVGYDVYGTGTHLDELMTLDSHPGAQGSYAIANDLRGVYVMATVGLSYRTIDKYNNVWLMGAYADCNLTKTILNNATAPNFYSAANSGTYTNAMHSSFMESFSFLSVGLKLQFCFGAPIK